MRDKQRISKTLKAILWIAQGLLAITFIWAGIMKIFMPDDLPFPWVKDNMQLVLITGVVDLLGGLGIVLPTVLNIQPKLTILAAYGIVFLMLVASAFHIMRGEAKDIGFNIFMALIAAFVAWGRQTKKN